MSETFDDLPSGSGEAPTKDQVLAVYNYMRARNRDTGTGKVLDEVKALGFVTSRGTVGRHLKGAPGRADPPKARGPVAKSKQENNSLDTPEKRTQRKRLNNRHEHKAAAAPQAEGGGPKGIGEVAALLIEKLADDTLASDIKDLLSKDGTQPKHSSTTLAIEENRIRMAVNIALGRRMIDKAEYLLLDMRGTAALVDALTCAVKVSGGAAIDISRPNAADPDKPGDLSPNGHAMKEINPRPSNGGLASDLAQFRRERAAGNGARA